MKSIVYYEKFSDNAVFTSAPLNVFFNQMFTFAINAMSEALISTSLMVDGPVAKILQGGTFNVKYLTVINLSTQSVELFNFLKAAITSLNVSELLIEDSEITFVVESKKVKITLLFIEPATVNYSGILLRDITEIT